MGAGREEMRVDTYTSGLTWWVGAQQLVDFY